MLSSRLTLIWWGFPLLWILWTGFFLVKGWIGVLFDDNQLSSTGNLLFTTVCCFGVNLFLLSFCGTLKKVYLSGDSLLISDFTKELICSFDKVKEVEGPDWSSLRRITIHLSGPSIFRGKITFTPTTFEAQEIANFLRQKIPAS